MRREHDGPFGEHQQRQLLRAMQFLTTEERRVVESFTSGDTLTCDEQITYNIAILKLREYML